LNLKASNIRSVSLNIASFFAMTVIIFSCAQIVPLTGGEKDVLAPKDSESFPKNGSVNFISKSITVKFDEYIKLTNVTSQLIVSPLMDTPPEISIKGKKLIIRLQSELNTNTTYSLNFGNAISDITENNNLPNYKYVFSTGNYIDSLSYTGTVVDAFDQSAKESIYVLLYDQFEDSVPLKELPRYVALTNKKGQYSITNIAQGKYKLFAINDVNSNYLFDLPNEEVGFEDKIISIDSSITKRVIYLFEETSDLQFLVKSEHKSYGEINLIFNNPTEELTITPVNKIFNNEEWSLIEKNNTGDSVTLWLYPDAFDKDIELEIRDNNEIIDTINFQVIPLSEFKDSTLKVSSNITSSFDLNKSLSIEINRPSINFKPFNTMLYEDSSLITTELLRELGSRSFIFSYDFKEDTEYNLLIPPNSFEDIYGLKNDTLKLDFKTKKESDYGIINLNIIPNFSGNYIVQLSKNKKIVTESYFIGEQTKQYKYLSPGVYSLKLIIDTNGDKKWNTGNYLERIQPEKVIIYNKEIKIRENWGNDINWTIKE